MVSRPTQRQMEALVEFLECNPGIARGLLRTHQAKQETRRKWQEFATAANALGGVTKDGSAWSKYWAEKKCAIKRLCQQRAISMRRTGGGVDMMPELSLLEQRLVAVMGGQSFATGNRDAAVPPFRPSGSQSSPSILDQPDSPSILNQPSTSAAAPVLNFALAPTPEEQVEAIQEQAEVHQQTGTGQQDVQSSTRRASRPIRRVSCLDTQVHRFEEIELKRVQAEMKTAEALGEIACAVKDMVRLLSTHLERQRQDHPS